VRTFCLLLILGNALFFSWAELIDVHVSSFDRASAANVAPPPRIVLAREASSEPEPAVVKDVQPPRVEPLNSSSTAQVATASGDAMSCTTVGPFADLADASHAQAALRSGGFAPRQRLEQGELWVGYWVSVQNLESRGAAESAVKTLSDSGIKDVYLMPGGDPANILSLGVFSDYHRAERRAEEIRALGFEPRIDDRKRAGSVYWLDVDLPEPGKSIDTSIFQTDPGKIMRLELRGCPGASANG
jgi:hypothetical protein